MSKGQETLPEGVEKALCPACEGSGCGVCLNKGVVLVTDDPAALNKSEEIGKSFSDHATADADVAEGFQVSPFLRGLGDTIEKSLASMEQRLSAHIDHRVGVLAGGTGTMAKSLADLSKAALAPAPQVASGPARAPKSTAPVTGVAALEKSFSDPTGREEQGLHPANLNPVQKSLVLQRMGGLVEQGKLDPMAVVRYETTNAIDEVVFKSVLGDDADAIQKAGVA